MTAYNTHVLVCDLCGHVFLEPLLKLATHTRSEAAQVGWKHLTVSAPPTVKYSNLRGAQHKNAHGVLDVCGDCAKNRDGFLPIVDLPVKLDILDYLKDKENGTAGEVRKTEGQVATNKKEAGRCCKDGDCTGGGEPDKKTCCKKEVAQTTVIGELHSVRSTATVRATFVYLPALRD